MMPILDPLDFLVVFSRQDRVRIKAVIRPPARKCAHQCRRNDMPDCVSLLSLQPCSQRSNTMSTSGDPEQSKRNFAQGYA